ncbi:MAG: F0F1 ATP synthase subunit B [Desulfobacterales bacterium]|jgi:F-type H+-transporting ATPase subunit b|nr:F0F1 ATP synthase subunit B [Desulfobacterales bacterium]MDH3827492.1 F0F1 ATP synthase subunit B [Desulfobacterales bacterium]MDH4009904.1 F0F1 ATP synthase subunit B [Desulfobacterales bacterium]
MGIPGFGRWPDHQRARVIVVGVLFALLLLSLGAGNALGASGGEGGTKGWVATDTWRVMNFVVLLVALIFVLRKPISQALSSRIKNIREQLESLEAHKAEAEKQLAQYNEKLSQLESEAEKIVEDYIKQGNEAKAKILKEAEATAEKLQVQARRNIEHEFGKARQELQRQVVEKSLVKAEETLKKAITAQDQDNLVDEYLDKVVV